MLVDSLKCTLLNGGKWIFVALLFLCGASVAQPLRTDGSTPFERRLVQLSPTSDDFFYEAKDDFEGSALKAGQSYFWIRYGKKSRISRSSYKGYALNADPYHVAQKRISFLLGSDCSHFIHRLLQLLGANYSYTKTRHFLDWVEKGRVQEWSECRNREFAENFQVLLEPTMESLRIGDLLVWPRALGERGMHGHVVLVTGISPLTVLHSKNHRVGIVQEILSPEDFVGAKALRWIGPLAYTPTVPIADLLRRKWDRDPSRCAPSRQ